MRFARNPGGKDLRKINMNKLWGWFNSGDIQASDHDSLLTEMGHKAHAQLSVMSTIFHHGSALAGDQQLAQADHLCLALTGEPRLAGILASASQLLACWQASGVAALQQISGPFSLAVMDSKTGQTWLAIDRSGIHTLSFAVRNKQLIFASRSDAVAAHPDVGGQLSLQSLYHYLYFFDIPAPATIFEGVEKLLPGQYVCFRNGQLERNFYWKMRYRDQPRHDFEEMSSRFHEILNASIARSADKDATAAFLSGGTDSSTVAGKLAEFQNKAARTYSIGFAADGFDEMEYARIAGRRFGLDMREYYLRPADILSAIPVIAAHYDEPFANESAVPSYFCARLAQADGYQVMLAGDGGDEIFGGNSRYAKQKVFEAYHALPALLRHGLIEPLASMPGLDRLPPTRKLQSYLRQANVPLPERMESYNYTYQQPLDQMFSADFLAAIDPALPVAALKDAYQRADSASCINQMLHLDLKFTLADNDLRKVNGMCEAAGIAVHYPLLDDAMVAFSGEVPPDWKVRGQQLRWFYKKALQGYLPDEIINKRKHGFGLPFGIWARDDAPLRERIEDRLSDFKKRGWLQPAYLEHIRSEHMTGHATYYGKMLWVIVTLEEWLAARNL